MTNLTMNEQCQSRFLSVANFGKDSQTLFVWVKWSKNKHCYSGYLCFYLQIAVTMLKYKQTLLKQITCFVCKLWWQIEQKQTIPYCVKVDI